MVEELIDSIKNAELKAENDIKESVKVSTEIVRKAEDIAHVTKKEGQKSIEAELKKTEALGKQLAEEEYSKIMFDAHKECEEIKAVAENNSGKAIEFIARGLFNKYGSR